MYTCYRLQLHDTETQSTVSKTLYLSKQQQIKQLPQGTIEDIYMKDRERESEGSSVLEAAFGLNVVQDLL